MKKRAVILFGVSLLITAIIILAWRMTGAVTLEFMGYKWQPTNHTWCAELKLVNSTQYAISYVDIDNVDTHFVYRVKESNGWSKAAVLWHSALIYPPIRDLEPKQDVTFLACLNLNDPKLREKELPSWPAQDELAEIPQAALSNQQLGVWYYIPKKSLNQMQRWQLQIKKALGNHAGSEQQYWSKIVWCPEMLSAPPDKK